MPRHVNAPEPLRLRIARNIPTVLRAPSRDWLGLLRGSNRVDLLPVPARKLAHPATH